MPSHAPTKVSRQRGAQKLDVTTLDHLHGEYTRRDKWVKGVKISASIPILKSHGPGTPREEAGAPDKMVPVDLLQSILTFWFSLSPQNSRVRYLEQR